MKIGDVKQFIAEFIKWAESQKEILGVLLVGSYARNTARQDSDIDLVIITDQQEVYLDSDKWIKNFGEVKEIIKEDYKRVQVRRVFYDNGLEIEYGITTKEWVKVDPIDPGTKRVIKGGARVLFDRDEILKLIMNKL